MKKKVLTLAFLYNPAQVLLGLKKRGFGVGRWHGYGGKVQEGEATSAAALRELEEESAIAGQALVAAGRVTFEFPATQEIFEVHLFRNSNFSGEAVETEEMSPQWFNRDQIPYDQMWPDAKLWLPQFLSGKNVEATIYLKDTETILKHKIRFY